MLARFVREMGAASLESLGIGHSFVILSFVIGHWDSVLQQILLLRDGQLENFHPVPPPSAVRRFLNRARLPQLQGLLVEVLAALRTRKQNHN